MNNQNLKPFTKENAKYYGKIGGVKSGIVRNQKKSIKEQLRILLDLKVLDEGTYNYLKRRGFEDEEINNQLLLINTLFDKALHGDTKAFELIFKLLRNTDIEKENQTNDNWNDMLNL